MVASILKYTTATTTKFQPPGMGRKWEGKGPYSTMRLLRAQGTHLNPCPWAARLAQG